MTDVSKRATIRSGPFVISALKRAQRGGCFCVHCAAEETGSGAVWPEGPRLERA